MLRIRCFFLGCVLFFAAMVAPQQSFAQPSFTNLVGIAAAGVNAMQVIPQVFHILKARRVEGLSDKAIWMGTLSSCLWEAYGLLLGDPVQIIGNAVLLSSNVVLLVAKLYFSRNEETRVLLPV